MVLVASVALIMSSEVIELTVTVPATAATGDAVVEVVSEDVVEVVSEDALFELEGAEYWFCPVCPTLPLSVS